MLSTVAGKVKYNFTDTLIDTFNMWILFDPIPY